MYNTEEVTPAPDRLERRSSTAASDYTGKVTAYDSPIYIADAALYLMNTQPDLGIENPYALDEDQLAAAVDLLKAQREHVGEYWSDYLKEIQAFKTGDSVVGTTWQVIVNLAQADKVPVEAILPESGSTGWSDTWMIGSKTEAPELRLPVAQPHRQPGGQRRGRRVVRRGAGQRQGLRPDQRGVLRDLPRRRRGLRRADLVLDDADRAVPRRAHRRRVHDVPGLDARPGPRSRASDRCGDPPPPPPAAAGAPPGAPDAVAGGGVPRRARGAVHHLAVDRRRLHRRHRAHVDAGQLPRPLHHRGLPDDHRPHAADRGVGDRHRRRDRLPDRAVHGQGRLAPAAAAAGDRGAHAAVGVVPREGLRLAGHALRDRPGRVDRCSRSASTRPATGWPPR